MLTKQKNIRMDENMLAEIETERQNFKALTGAKLDEAEFIRVLIRYGLKVAKSNIELVDQEEAY